MSRGQYVIYERTLKDGERLFLQTAREVIEEIEELDRKPRTHPSRAVTERIFTGGGWYMQKEREASLKVIAYNIGQLLRFRTRLEIEIQD